MDFFRSTLRVTSVLTVPFILINILVDPLFIPILALFIAVLGVLYLKVPVWPDLLTFRMFCLLLSGMIFFLLITRGTMDVYYIFTLIMPIMYYALLGHREGIVWSSSFLFLVVVQMIVLHPFSPMLLTAISASYLAVTAIGFYIHGMYVHALEALRDAHEELIRQHELLTEARREVDTLQSVLPMCSGCKQIMDEHGDYVPVDEYIKKHTSQEITHGLCPSCVRKYYPDMADELLSGREHSHV